MHRQQVLRRHGGAGGVELELADRDAHPVGAQVAQAEDALPDEAQMTRTSFTGQFRSTSLIRPRCLRETYRPRGRRKMWPNFRHASPTVGS